MDDIEWIENILFAGNVPRVIVRARNVFQRETE